MGTVHAKVARFVSFAQTPWRHALAVRIALLAALTLALPVAASAQPLGTFRWQLQPYCNIVTVTIIQQGAQYTLDGTDDQCAAGRQASVRGMAFQNPNGTIGFGITVVTTPRGAPVHVDAAISMITLSGTWTDSGGNSGNFVLTPGPGVPGIGPRPATSGPQAHYEEANHTTVISSNPTLIRSLPMNVPAHGRLIVSASGYFALRSTGQDLARCSINTDTTIVVDPAIHIQVDDFGNTSSQAFIPMAATRGFSVSPGGLFVMLVCQRLAGAVEIRNTSLTVLFVASPP